MIWTDGVHLVALDEDELHQFAKRIGLKREWFQGKPKHRFPHYDLTTPAMVQKALDAGAVRCSSRDIVRAFVYMRQTKPVPAPAHICEPKGEPIRDPYANPLRNPYERK